jgi:hypothetical protein
MRRSQPPHPIPYNPARVRRDRWLRRAGFRLRMFVKFAPGVLGFIFLVWFSVWLVGLVMSR